MANIFLDSNKVFDIISRNTAIKKDLEGHTIYVSPLSIHIFAYSAKIKIPNKDLNDAVNELKVVPFSPLLLTFALQGPTADLEDNIQLHSAAESDCEYFLTEDKKLLKMKFFGKTKIVSQIS